MHDDHYLFIDWLFIFVFLRCCIKEALLLLFAREKENQEHHHASVVLLFAISVPATCVDREQVSITPSTCVPARVSGWSNFWESHRCVYSLRHALVPGSKMFLVFEYKVTAIKYFDYFLGVFVELHCVPRPTTTVVYNISMLSMSTSENSLVGVPRTGTASRYIFVLH